MGKIGLSLSACIRDIVSGKVAIGEVDKIITILLGLRRMFKKDYQVTYETIGGAFPEKAQEIFWELWNSGKIEQPRLLGQKPLMWDKQERNWL